ncbi:ferritin-like domain-containing protein [Brockia lithotrophica]|uniref:DUF2202 domain-containing protein n=1 Tax=Brockia lithotrophica TaxID=933949 RepID=A0A660KZQ4_9BACL|nr:hypothetical protein [Brockia lithotrophica]RKQ83513.1 hypothetical protein C7438_1766 [Brockia lithotrophica]
MLEAKKAIVAGLIVLGIGALGGTAYALCGQSGKAEPKGTSYAVENAAQGAATSPNAHQYRAQTRATDPSQQPTTGTGQGTEAPTAPVDSAPATSQEGDVAMVAHIGALNDPDLDLAKMLTYAIQDEYIAHAEYTKILETYGTVNPFANIREAEAQHIALLTPLLEKYGVPVPDRASISAYVSVPPSLRDAALTGVQAEIDNIAMYDRFLSDPTLPADVRDAFLKLKSASTNHLAAFERAAARY